MQATQNTGDKSPGKVFEAPENEYSAYTGRPARPHDWILSDRKTASSVRISYESCYKAMLTAAQHPAYLWMAVQEANKSLAATNRLATKTAELTNEKPDLEPLLATDCLAVRPDLKVYNCGAELEVQLYSPARKSYVLRAYAFEWINETYQVRAEWHFKTCSEMRYRAKAYAKKCNECLTSYLRWLNQHPDSKVRKAEWLTSFALNLPIWDPETKSVTHQ